MVRSSEYKKMKQKNNKTFFGTDGIRGKANSFPMTADVAIKTGMAVGIILKTKNKQDGSRHRVVIGKDTRLSGYMIESALVAGFTAAGTDVFLLGPIPTPAVSMLTRSLRADIGVMISASHNPFEDNGIKLFGVDGYKISDKFESDITKLIESDMGRQLAQSQDIGRAKRIDGVHDRYIEFAKRTLPKKMSLEGLRVVIDCANGAAYKVAPAALWEMGADVITIGASPDGLNINDKCGSTSPETLAGKIRETRADIGIALDGDADRVIIVDEAGQVVDGDQLMALVAQSWKEQDRLSKDGIVATIMSNLGLERFLESINLALERTQVGDRNVVERMRKDGYNVGGEQSGHIVLSDYVTTGDGLVAALQVLAVVKTWDKPVSEACQRFEPVPQILQNVRHKNDRDLVGNKEVVKAIRNAETKLKKSGRLVVRASGTEPLIRVMGEGDNEVLVQDVVGEVAETIRQAAN